MSTQDLPYLIAGVDSAATSPVGVTVVDTVDRLRESNMLRVIIHNRSTAAEIIPARTLLATASLVGVINLDERV